jgi:hypothetical protein
MNRNTTAFALGLFLFLRWREPGAMIWSALLLIVTLLATGPLSVSAAATDTVRLAERLDGGRGDRVLGWQVSLRFLEADYGDPGRDHPSGFGSSLDTLAGLLSGRYSSASRVSVGTFNGERFSCVYPGRSVWREYGV